MDMTIGDSDSWDRFEIVSVVSSGYLDGYSRDGHRISLYGKPGPPARVNLCTKSPAAKRLVIHGRKVPKPCCKIVSWAHRERSLGLVGTQFHRFAKMIELFIFFY